MTMPSRTVEERLAELEATVAQLASKESEAKKPAPWWEKHFGAFKASPYYEEASRLGAEYRRSQPIAADDLEDDVPAGY